MTERPSVAQWQAFTSVSDPIMKGWVAPDVSIAERVRDALWMLKPGGIFRRVVTHRPPNLVIGGWDNPYLLRWWLIPRNRFANAYLHLILREDDDRAIHDHPWENVSIPLTPGLREVVGVTGAHKRRIKVAMDGDTCERVLRFPVRARELRPGKVYPRWGQSAHRLIIDPRLTRPHTNSVWTLFLTGPRRRVWGFHCTNGTDEKWVPHYKFTAGSDGALIGAGCGETV